MKNRRVNLMLLLAGLIGAGMFGYSLVQQTALQDRMNNTMALINNTILATGVVVQKTSEALQPLAETTQALDTIEQREEQTVTNLTAMNNHLSTTAQSEQGIIQGLETLNHVTADVSTDLDRMGQVNDSLLQASGGSVSQARRMAQQVGTLNGMTQTSITQLHALNAKLAPLRLVQLP